MAGVVAGRMILQKTCRLSAPRERAAWITEGLTSLTPSTAPMVGAEWPL